MVHRPTRTVRNCPVEKTGTCARWSKCLLRTHSKQTALFWLVRQGGGTYAAERHRQRGRYRTNGNCRYAWMPLNPVSSRSHGVIMFKVKRTYSDTSTAEVPVSLCLIYVCASHVCLSHICLSPTLFHCFAVFLTHLVSHCMPLTSFTVSVCRSHHCSLPT